MAYTFMNELKTDGGKGAMRTKYPEHTRQSLLEAAAKLFINKGYAATRLEDIAKSAGLTRGAISFHFKNKMNIFRDLTEYYTNVVGEEFRDVDQLQAGPVERMEYVIRKLFNSPNVYILNGLMQIMQGEMQDIASDVLGQNRPEVDLFIGRIENILRDGVATGDFSEEIEPEFCSHLIFNLFLGAIAKLNIALKEYPNDVVIEKNVMLLMGCILNGRR